MEYVHIKNLEKYHPGYKDRELKWAKLWFTMAQGDPEFELIKDEIDKWRFAAMICLELESKKPLPNIDEYWVKKFDIKKRPMSLTLQMLHNFIDIDTQDTELPYTEKSKNKKENKSKIGCNAQLSDFDFINELKTKEVYKGIDIDRELGKMDTYLMTRPGRQKTRRFIVAWLNRIDKPLIAVVKPKPKARPGCTGCNGTGKIQEGDQKGAQCWCVV